METINVLGKIAIAHTVQGEEIFRGEVIACKNSPTVTIELLDGTTIVWLTNLCEFIETGPETSVPKIVKPPIGIMPSYIWKQKRIEELAAAISRLIEAQTYINHQDTVFLWLKELEDLIRQTETSDQHQNSIEICICGHPKWEHAASCTYQLCCCDGFVLSGGDK